MKVEEPYYDADTGTWCVVFSFSAGKPIYKSFHCPVEAMKFYTEHKKEESDEQQS